jgi:hypothetical protein
MKNRKLTILDAHKVEWFLGPDNVQRNYTPVCYHYVICHSLLNYLTENDYDFDKGKEVLERLLESAGNGSEGQPSHFREEGFMELLPLAENWGFVVVDQSDGMYPLVCYSDKRVKRIKENSDVEVDYRNRATAFREALKNVSDKYFEVHEHLKNKKPEDWTKKFQEGLFQATDGFAFMLTATTLGASKEG